MLLSYESIKDKPKLLTAMTSLNKEEFEDLCELFEQAWDEYKENEGYHDESQGGRKPVLKTPEDKLFFILFYMKLYPLQEVIGYLFGMSQSQGNHWVHVLSQVLKMALQCNDYLPQRVPEKIAEKLQQEATEAVAIDGTERRRQRPLDNEEQRLYYSGKKKAHTLKNDPERRHFSRNPKWVQSDFGSEKLATTLPSAARVRPASATACTSRCAMAPTNDLTPCRMPGVFAPPALPRRLRQNTRPYGYAGVVVHRSSAIAPSLPVLLPCTCARRQTHRPQHAHSAASVHGRSFH